MDLASMLHPATGVAHDAPISWATITTSENGSQADHMPLSDEQSMTDEDVEDAIPTPTGTHDRTPSADPVELQLEPHIIQTYLDHYFRHANTMYWIIPRVAFTEWLFTCQQKSFHDTLVLKAMLAHGSVFENTPESRLHAHELAKTVEARARSPGEDELCLQILLIRLILAMYQLRIGNLHHARDYAGWSLRGACIMGLLTEEGVTSLNDGEPMFGLGREILCECRRRVFWTGFLMECVGTVDMPSLSMYNGTNCRLSLPCRDHDYDRGITAQTPVFTTSSSLIAAVNHPDHAHVGTMAYFVEIAAIWGDVNKWAFQFPSQPTEQDIVKFATRYHEGNSRLAAWYNAYQSFLRTYHDQPGLVTSLHFLYRGSLMRLNRHLSAHYLTDTNTDHVIKKAFDNARETLKLAQSYMEQRLDKRPQSRGLTDVRPHIAYIIVSAVDIATSTGRLQDILQPDSSLISGVAAALAMIEDLANSWPGLEVRQQLVAARFKTLLDTNLATIHGKAAYWIREPIDSTFGLEKDLIYNTPRSRILHAIGHEHDVFDEDVLLEIP